MCVCVCVLMLCLCGWFCGGPTVLALDVRDLQDWQKQLKCILDVVGTVGSLQRHHNPHHHHHHHHFQCRPNMILPFKEWVTDVYLKIFFLQF